MSVKISELDKVYKAGKERLYEMSHMSGTPDFVVVGGKQLRGLFTMIQQSVPEWLCDSDVYEIWHGKGIFQVMFDEAWDPVASVKVSDEVRE